MYSLIPNKKCRPLCIPLRVKSEFQILCVTQHSEAIKHKQTHSVSSCFTVFDEQITHLTRTHLKVSCLWYNHTHTLGMNLDSQINEVRSFSHKCHMKQLFCEVRKSKPLFPSSLWWVFLHHPMSSYENSSPPCMLSLPISRWHNHILQIVQETQTLPSYWALSVCCISPWQASWRVYWRLVEARIGGLR